MSAEPPAAAEAPPPSAPPPSAPPGPPVPTRAPSAAVPWPAGEVVYEIEAVLDPTAVADYDAWLPGHAAEVLASPGFRSVEILRPVDGVAGDRPRRISRYRVRDRGALEAYVETRAPALREAAAARFGDRARFERRVLAAGTRLAAPTVERRCANCEAALHGEWCAACGQRAHESARSLGTLFHDVWHVLTHVDGTLWRTLRTLAARPGVLTVEYFRDRRASYLPPFRLYLVLSLAFFALAALTARDAPVVIAPAAAVGADERARLESEARGIANARRELAGAGALGGALDGALARREQEIRAALGAGGAAAPAAADPQGLLVAARFDGRACAEIDVEPAWIARRLERPLVAACERAAADGGRSIARAFLANVPKMMFVFLPAMAAALLLLYWRPRRYYVEHLVFFLHLHAALFLAFTALTLAGALGRLLPPVDAVVRLLGFATFLYAAWYVWRAMRVHYGDGRLLTAAKFAIVGLCYVTSMLVTLLGTAIYSALTA